MMPGAFQPLTPSFSTRTEAEKDLAAIPAWKQRRKDHLKAKIRRSWYITGMESIVPVYENARPAVGQRPCGWFAQCRRSRRW
jgi:hypothetical protein